jgi:outer membrane protein assembly factor BamB
MITRLAPLLFALLPVSVATSGDNWTQFRGPGAQGVVENPALPAEWDETAIKWKAMLKGSGQSSPVIWEDKLFLTSASPDGRERYLICLSATDGKILWEETIACEKPEDIHVMNSYATPSCATDGKHVVAFFGPGGLHCYSIDGKKEWSVPLGDFTGTWGVAASPVIVDGIVIQNGDSEGPSRLVAVELATGKIAWETPRETKPKGGWSTPALIEHEGKKELVLNGEFGVQGYDPVTGRELWFCEAPTGRGEPVPVYARGKLYVVCGKPGDAYCVLPGGSGNVTATNRIWLAPRKGGRDLPSPSVVGDFLVISSMSGIVSSYDAETGFVHYSERLGESMEIAAAPLVANGLIYYQTVKGGNVVVLRPGKTLDVVAVNSLGNGAKEENFRAVPVPLGDRLLLRAGSTLYCIGR